MPDRDGIEPNRAFDQVLRRLDRRASSLERTAQRTGTTRFAECPERFFTSPFGSIGADMIEFDIDPGTWLVEGQLQFAIHWTGGSTETMPGWQFASSLLTWRLPGTPREPIDPPGGFVHFKEAPLAEPINRGFAVDVYWRTTIPFAKVLSGDTGWTLALTGTMFDQSGFTGILDDDEFYMGPGIMTATPL